MSTSKRIDLDAEQAEPITDYELRQLRLRVAECGMTERWSQWVVQALIARLDVAEDKADQWDAAQPMIEAMTELVESVRRMTQDGHPFGPTGGDDWFKIMMRRLDSIDRLLPQGEPE